MDHMHMGSLMDMASMTMGSLMDMASMTMGSLMDMASMTMSSMASMATGAMAGMDHSGMDHSGMGSMNHTGMGSMDHMSMGGMGHMMMHMYFTSNYKNYPVLFKGLKAANGGEAFGVFLLFFFVSFLNKGIEFVKNYLELKVWNNPNYQPSKTTTIVEDCACDDDDEEDDGKVSDATEGTTPTGTHQKSSALTVLIRDFTRLVLCFLSELLGYAMMLVAMSYSLVYFFAVVLGMAVGRLFFERLSDKLQLRPGGNNFQGHH